MDWKLLKTDPSLAPFARDIALRMARYQSTLETLLSPEQTLKDFANAYHYFGFQKTADGWYYREWAPGADSLFLTGDFCNWNEEKYPLKPIKNGVFEIFLPGTDAVKHEDSVLVLLEKDGEILPRIPLYARNVTEEKGVWNGKIWDPEKPFSWTDSDFQPAKDLFIYECHIGMAQEKLGVGTYGEFTENILPKVKNLGYTAIQLMGILEHPYYASFGYQVSNFFAPSSRFGTPDDLKKLMDTAHKMGIAVLLDIVHSHACANTREGIAGFDGFFHPGAHPAWGTRLFDYGKPEVLHFLLSNLKYWLEEFHFDGFRFDGVTSMLYHDHGLGANFTHPGQYFSMNTHLEAVTYLQLATTLTRQVNPRAILIAEDMSAMPGLCRPVDEGGLGFDYRLAMGEPDLWVNLLRIPDEHWDLNRIYYELTLRRPAERVIGYCESHDQALVGDKTLMFRLCDAEMYTAMEKESQNPVIDRGMALHKLMRLLTVTLGGEGYLTFMGNEFGHPEWIDFPREGNHWSFHYCRRRWDLAENGDLKYGFLREFERDMIKLCKQYEIFGKQDTQIQLDNTAKVLVYQKENLLFAVNLHPVNSYDGWEIPVKNPGNYKVLMSTDDACYGGFARVQHRTYLAGQNFKIYLPNRTATVFELKMENYGSLGTALGPL